MKIVRTSEMEWQPALDRGRFSQRRKPLGGQKLPCSVFELAPGKTSFPLHAHHVTEEALYVLSGRARLRTSEGEETLGPGDYVSFPAGGPAHQLINDGAEPFVYLGLSAVMGFDIVEYPDSGKLAAAIGAFPTGKRFMFRQKDQVDYFDGEE